jgi:uncharacterized membrane protein
MGFAVILLFGLAGLVAMLLVGRQNGVFVGHGVRIPTHPTSPLDEAERILARRYARGQFTPEEYSRMLVILRR